MLTTGKNAHSMLTTYKTRTTLDIQFLKSLTTLPTDTLTSLAYAHNAG